MKLPRRLLFSILIILPTIACQAAMRLVTGSAPASAASGTSLPPATLPAAEATAQLTCPNEARSVVVAANTEMLAPNHFPTVDTNAALDVPLVSYEIRGDDLSAPMLEQVPHSLMGYQRDFVTQHAAWQLFTELVPAAQRGMLRRFEIITDGPGGVLSAVEQTADDPHYWVLQTDIADMEDTKNLAFTLLHEYGHLLTLGPQQVPPDVLVFNNPDNERVRERAVEACPSYFPGEGCSLPTSYINAFFDLFWRDLYAQWTAIDQEESYEQRETELHAFYRKHRDQFVDSYAVTSPVEDIAESWAFFVLSPRPTSDRILDQKLEFFYAYPELVTLRGEILSGLCTANP